MINLKIVKKKIINLRTPLKVMKNNQKNKNYNKSMKYQKIMKLIKINPKTLKIKNKNILNLPPFLKKNTQKMIRSRMNIAIHHLHHLLQNILNIPIALKTQLIYINQIILMMKIPKENNQKQFNKIILKILSFKKLILSIKTQQP